MLSDLFEFVAKAPVQFWSMIIALFGGLNFIMALLNYKRSLASSRPSSAKSPPHRSNEAGINREEI